MRHGKYISLALLFLSCLLLPGGCAPRSHQDSSTSTTPYYHDESGRAFYRDAAGRSYYKDEQGTRHYMEPVMVERAPVSVGEVPVRYYVDTSGKRYLMDETGSRYYISDDIRRIFVDDTGNRFYLDVYGVKHFIKDGVVRTYYTDAAGVVYYVDESGARYYVPDVAKRYYLDEGGRKFYVVDSDRRFIVDERGTRYYIVDTAPAVVSTPVQPLPRMVEEPVRVIRMGEPMSAREAAMLACNSKWNACRSDCANLDFETARDRCARRCDNDHEECTRNY
jgi:hypothetical protein